MLRSFCLALLILASPASAQDKAFSLSAPQELIDSGLLKHILPRFSLKTGVRITVQNAPADAAFGEDGVPVFRRDDVVWHFAAPDTPDEARFREWLRSDVGKRTIDGFAPKSGQPFSSDVAVEIIEVVVEPTGDVLTGERISLSQCGRCHVVNDSNRMNAIGSSPSFALMRSFEDWERRFRTFFLLKPHPAFTQVADVTEPFSDQSLSPIVPIEVTLEQIEAILAFVNTIPPADLGAPLKFQ